MSLGAVSEGISRSDVLEVVPGAGLEPARPQGRGILSPLRLPVSPPGPFFEELEAKRYRSNFNLALSQRIRIL